MKRWQMVCIGIYTIGAIWAFGDCAQNTEKSVNAEYASCRTDERAICFRGSERIVFSSTFAAMCWPLYASWRIQS